MKSATYKPANSRVRVSGFSILELLIVVAIALILAGIMFPEFLRISYNIRLKNAAVNISGLIQQTRMLAARQNAIYTLNMTAAGGQACIDLNNNGTCEAGEPTIRFNSSVAPAATAPPGAYVLVGDTGGVVFTNGTT